MVETQLCKLRGDLYIFVQKEIISYCTKKVVACLVDLMRVGIGENTFPSHELVVSRVTHHRQPCSVLCAGPGYYVPGASSALRKRTRNCYTPRSNPTHASHKHTLVDNALGPNAGRVSNEFPDGCLSDWSRLAFRPPGVFSEERHLKTLQSRGAAPAFLPAASLASTPPNGWG